MIPAAQPVIKAAARHPVLLGVTLGAAIAIGAIWVAGETLVKLARSGVLTLRIGTERT
jgi:hypothetical protein